MLDIPDDVGCSHGDLHSRPPEPPQESSEEDGNSRVLIVRGRRDGIPAKLLLPLGSILLITSFLAGRATRSDWQHLAVSARDALMGQHKTATGKAPRPSKGNAPASETVATVEKEPKPKADTPLKKPGPDSDEDYRKDLQRAAEGELARIKKLEEIKERAEKRMEASDAERREQEQLADRRRQFRAIRPVPMDELQTVQRALLDRELKQTLERLELMPQSSKGETLAPGTVWRGEKTYRQGAQAGKTETYELHVKEREGYRFKGIKFEHGLHGSRVEVEGWAAGEVISWLEAQPDSLLTMRGTLAENLISVAFESVYVSGATNIGDGTLTRQGVENARMPANPLQLHVANPGFEAVSLVPGQFTRPNPYGAVGASDPIPEWSLNPANSDAGTQHMTNDEYHEGLSEGSNVAYVSRTQNIVNMGIAGGSYISQTINTKLAAHSIYELRVDVGQRVDYQFPPDGGYYVKLLAGSTVLAQDNNSKAIAPGSFITSILVYSADPANPSIGKPLEIHLGLRNPQERGGQVNFDNVRLTIIPEH